MKIKLPVFALLLFFAATCFADLYVWTDENGVKHYGDRPPEPGATSPEQVKQYETPKYAFNHRLYRRQGDKEFCGERQLPEKGDDSKIFLVNVLGAYKGARKTRSMMLKQYESAPTEAAKKYYRMQLDEYECIMEWGKAVSNEMEPVKLQIIKEARLAQKEYDEIQKRCGEEPSPGWHTDEEAKKWAECNLRVKNQHNELLRKLKSKLTMEQALKEGLEE